MARKALFPFLMAAALAGSYMPGYTQSTGETAGAVHPAILPEDSARAIRRQPPTVEQQAERISRQMQRRLVLDNKQYAKVYKLNLKYLKKLEDSATGWKTSPDRPEGFGGRMGGPHGISFAGLSEQDQAKRFSPDTQGIFTFTAVARRDNRSTAQKSHP